MNEAHILIRLLWMYIPRNWEFGSALAKLRNFGGGGLKPQTLPFGTPLEVATFCSAVEIKVTLFPETVNVVMSGTE
jgi:hypothetical protein